MTKANVALNLASLEIQIDNTVHDAWQICQNWANGTIRRIISTLTIGGSRGGRARRAPPLRVQILSF